MTTPALLPRGNLMLYPSFSSLLLYRSEQKKTRLETSIPQALEEPRRGREALTMGSKKAVKLQTSLCGAATRVCNFLLVLFRVAKWPLRGPTKPGDGPKMAP